MPRKSEGPREQPVEKTKELQKTKEGPKETLEGYLPKVKAAEVAARINSNPVLAGELQACLRSINIAVSSIESFGVDKTHNLKQQVEGWMPHWPMTRRLN